MIQTALQIARGMITTRDPARLSEKNRNPFYVLCRTNMTDEELMFYIGTLSEDMRAKLRELTRWVMDYEKTKTRTPFYQLPKLPVLRLSRSSPFVGKET